MSDLVLFRRVIPLLFLVLMPGWLVAQGSLTLEYKFGFDGYYRPGAWVPIFVTASNQPAAGQSLNDIEEFTGQVMVIFNPLDEDGSPIRFARDIQVPPSSTKRYVLFAKAPGKLGPTPMLYLNRQNGKTESTHRLDLNPLDEDTLLVVNVSESLARPNLPLLRGGLDNILFSKVAPSELPDHWAAWDAADMVILEGWPSSGMSQEAVQALRDWVAQGGTLVMLAGQNASTYVDAMAKDLLPVDLAGDRYIVETGTKIGIAATAPERTEGTLAYLVSASRPKAGAEVLHELDGLPLMVRQPRGDGQIIFFAHDFKTASRQLEQFFMPTWQAVVPLRNLASPEPEFHRALRSFQALTGSAAKPPNHFLIILICLLYTIVVGPLNFGYLSRKKKLEWAWVTVPAVVLAFFLLVYGLGRVTKGNTNLFRELEVEHLVQGQVEGFSSSVVNTFVSNPGNHYIRPLRDRHALGDPFRWHEIESYRIGSAFAAFQGMAGTVGPSVSLTSNPPLINYDNAKGQIFVSSWEMGTFDAQTFVAAGPIEKGGSVDAFLTWQNGRLGGTIYNNTKNDFEESWIIVSNDALRIGPLQAGKSFEFEEPVLLVGYPGPGQARWTDAVGLFEGKAVSSPRNATEVSTNNFGVYMDSIYNPPVTSRLLPPMAGEVIFLGYRQENESPLKPISTINPDESSRAVATMVRLSPRVAGPEFFVPGNHIKVRFHDYALETNKGGSFSFDSSENIELKDSFGVFSAELPFAHPQLAVTNYIIRKSGAAADNQEFGLQVYSYGQRNWVTIPFDEPQANKDMALPITGRLYFRIISQTKPNTQQGWGNSSITAIVVDMKGSVPEE